jgi:hypothetical protein
MINFNDVELVVENKYSFVGIQRQNAKLQFYLPKGFSDKLKDLQNFDTKCQLFFVFYQIFEKFKDICIEKGYLEDNYKIRTSDRDGVIKINQGSTISISEQEEENIFYSKLDIITNILKAYDEPKILSLVYRLGRSEKINYSQFHKFLHNAIFLPNGTAYIDHMNLPRQQVQFDSTDIVAMYCYILWEIKQQLNQEISAEIKSLAERFRQDYIGSEYGLFQESFYFQIIEMLKDALELIDRHTPLKDSDYWELYEVIELFLYGEITHNEDGEIWGINNFNNIWESMCLTYLAKNTHSNFLLYLDTQFVADEIIAKWKESTKMIDFLNIFHVNGSQLRPDTVIFSSSLNICLDTQYTISESNWDDYQYWTTVILRNSNKFCLKIAYIRQPKLYHTINKLRNFYSVNDHDDLIINKPLPDDYFSYWDVKEINQEEINKMNYFNHIFYLSYKHGIFSYKSFNTIEDIILSICDPKYANDNMDSFEVFKSSIFRDWSINDVEKLLTFFLEKLLTFYKPHLNIIDIKYMPESIFLDSQNIELIKARNVRKQFVYEYLVEKAIKNSPDEIKKLNICSDFWLPSCGQTTLIENGQPFMDGYIGLKNIDFIDLAQDYCSQDFSPIQNQSQTRQTTPESSYQLQTTKTTTTTWSVNDSVKHINFGMGKVTHILGSGQRINLAVKFDSCGQKIIDPRIAPMVKLEN